MPKCEKCRREVDSVGTAYLTDRVKVPNVCSKCSKALVQNDLDSFADDIMEKLTGFVNGGNTKVLAKALCDSFVRKHRYLQGEVMQAVWQMFEQYKDTSTDQRNEWAVKWAGRCCDVVATPQEK